MWIDLITELTVERSITATVATAKRFMRDRIVDAWVLVVLVTASKHMACNRHSMSGNQSSYF
jgi:hypothetical protein